MTPNQRDDSVMRRTKGAQRASITDEVNDAAAWCAAHGSTGKPGERLPELLSARALDLINAGLASFALLVEEHLQQAMAAERVRRQLRVSGVANDR